MIIELQNKYKKHYLFAIIGLLLIIVYFWQPLYHHWIIMIILILLTVGFFGLAKETRQTYVNECFKTVYRKGLEKQFTNVKVDFPLDKKQKKDITNQILQADLKYIDPEYTLDPVVAVECEYENLRLQMYEYQLVKIKQQSKNSDEQKTVKFEGRFLKIYLPNSFIGEVHMHTFVEAFMKYKKRLEKVEFEDVEFNNTFKVFASSQMDAFRLIQAKTLRHFVEIYNKRLLNMEDIDICFLDGTFCSAKEASNTSIRVPFFKPMDFEKAKAGIDKVGNWIKRDIKDFKLDSEKYVTGR